MRNSFQMLKYEVTITTSSVELVNICNYIQDLAPTRAQRYISPPANIEEKHRVGILIWK